MDTFGSFEVESVVREFITDSLKAGVWVSRTLQDAVPRHSIMATMVEEGLLTETPLADDLGWRYNLSQNAITHIYMCEQDRKIRRLTAKESGAKPSILSRWFRRIQLI